MSTHGYHMGGFVGFFNAISELAMRFNPREIIVVWGDLSGHEKHHQEIKKSKGGLPRQNLNRFYGEDIPDSSQNRNEQIKKSVAAMKNLPIKQIYVPEFRVDIAIAALIDLLDEKFAKANNYVIVSSNKNLYQLITERIGVWSPGKKQVINSLVCLRDYFVSPTNFCLARAIAGDSSHGIIGIPSFGFKRVSKVLPQMALEVPFLYSELLAMVSDESSTGTKLEIIREHLELIKNNVQSTDLNSRHSTSVENKIQLVYDSDRGQGKANKIELYRQFSKEGLTSFNIDLLLSSVKHGIKTHD